MDWEKARRQHARKAKNKNKPTSNPEPKATEVLEQPQKTAEKKKPRKRTWWPHKLKKKATAPRNSSSKRKAFFILCSLPFIALGLVALFFLSSWNRVQTIAVKGQEVIDAKAIKQVAEVRPGMSKNYAKSLENVAARRLQNTFPEIKAVSFKLNEHNDLLITVQEQEVIGYVKKEDFFYPVMEEQQILNRSTPHQPDNRPLFIGFSDQEVLDMVQQFRGLPQGLLGQIASVENVESQDYPERLACRMKDGNIVTGLQGHIGENLKYYEAVVRDLDGKTGIIDMDAGIYFTEKTPLTDPFASRKEKEAYRAEQKALGQDPEVEREALEPQKAAKPEEKEEDEADRDETPQPKENETPENPD